MNEVIEINKKDFEKLENYLKNNNYSFEYRPHAVFLARKEGITLTLYESGKLLITGKNSNQFISTYFKNYNLKSSKINEKIQQKEFIIRIGTDESGKGDYFGFLTIGGVLIDSEDVENKLMELGVKDSKTLSETSIFKLDKEIKNLCKTSTIKISPYKYNELFSKLKNLNKILAWGHARAIENLLLNNECNKAISDQFGDEKYIINALMAQGKKIELLQMPHAESDIAVAAASIIARAEFLRRLVEMSRKYEIDFVKGANDKVIEIGKKIINKYGENSLKGVAKIHFKTTEKILGTQ